jgi:peptidoglycan/xylan/chitin deacetylase (PgdA/CDA1 family)
VSDPRLALVFDDCYAEDRSEVAPLLADTEAPATFAVVPEWIGEAGHLTAADLDDLADRGHEVAAHGRRHRYCQALDLARPVEAGDRRAFVDGDVSPGGDRRTFAGDTYEVTDGDAVERVRVAGTGAADGGQYLAVEGGFDSGFAPGGTAVRPTEAVLDDEIPGARRMLRGLGHDPSTFVFPYDAADPRAWRLAAAEYRVVPNASVRSLPNPPGRPLTDLRRYYLETTHLTRPGIATYLDAVADLGGTGVLAGHSAWDSVTAERVAWVVRAARDRGIAVTTLEALPSDRQR